MGLLKISTEMINCLLNLNGYLLSSCWRRRMDSNFSARQGQDSSFLDSGWLVVPNPQRKRRPLTDLALRRDRPAQ